MLPTELTKRVDDIKTPSNRVLIIVLLLGISIVTTAYYQVTQARLEDCEIHCARNDLIIDSLRKDQLMKSEADNQRLKTRIAWQDSVKDVLQGIVNKQNK